MGKAAPIARLKRFYLDGFAVGDDRRRQELLAQRDMEALVRLAGTDGAVPVLGTVEELEDGLAIVTEWPAGPTLASFLETDQLDADERRDLAEALLMALGSVHAQGVVHRALTPECAHVLTNGAVVLTDFDFARVPGADAITHYLSGSEITPYQAPEVRLDPAKASLQSDVWSAARIVAEILGAMERRRAGRASAAWPLGPRASRSGAAR